jgi:hypothetical protein
MSKIKMILLTLAYQTGIGAAISVICLIITTILGLDDLYKIIITYAGLLLSVPIALIELKKIGVN